MVLIRRPGAEAVLYVSAKRFCEPVSERRSWLIWFYDTSKQGMGALAIHLANVWLAGRYFGDPCTWYIINFLLDSTIGLVIIFFGIRTSQHLSKRKGWEAINFGEYGMQYFCTKFKPYTYNMVLIWICFFVKNDEVFYFAKFVFSF